MRKRTTIALLVGLAVFAASFAFAAGFGGLTTGTVGAANATVAACDTDGIATSYGASTWDATDQRYEVATVTVAGVSDSCDGASMKVTVNDTGGTQLTEGTLTIPTSAATSFNVTLSPAASAAAVTGVHVSIGT